MSKKTKENNRDQDRKKLLAFWRLGMHLHFAAHERYVRGESPAICGALSDLFLVVFFQSALVCYLTV
jgi:hypothetical protein